MIHMLKKWRVTVRTENTEAPASTDSTTFGFCDDHIANVMRDVAKMDFGPNVKSVEIAEWEWGVDSKQHGTTTTVSGGKWS
jgi:hypothetical protein